jgi:hypothetical protein
MIPKLRTTNLVNRSKSVTVITSWCNSDKISTTRNAQKIFNSSYSWMTDLIDIDNNYKNYNSR